MMRMRNKSTQMCADQSTHGLRPDELRFSQLMMRLWQLLVVVLLISGCDRTPASMGKQTTSGDGAMSNNGVAKTPNTTPASTVSKIVPAVAPPSPTTVLEAVYGEKVAEEDVQKLSDGRYVSFWHGSAFRLDGKEYFVGFTEATPPSEIEYPEQGNMVSLSQATYILENGAWKQLNTQQGIGDFGAYNKPPKADPDEAEQIVLSGNKLFLAAPSSESGTAGAWLTFYELFAMSPNDLGWSYVGRIKGGTDTRAGCVQDESIEQPVKCYANSAQLTFRETGKSGWPELTVRLDGQTMGANGEIRPTSNADVIEYRHDEAASRYSNQNH